MKDASLDLQAPLFTHAELCLAANLSRATLDKWLHRDLVKPNRLSRQKKRGLHVFSVTTIFEMKVTAELVKHLDVPPSQAVTIAKKTTKDEWMQTVARNRATPQFPEVVA